MNPTSWAWGAVGIICIVAQSLLCSVADASPPPAPELASRNATESENDSAQAGRQFEAGQAHYQNGQFAAAIAAYQRALAIWTGLGDQAAVAQTQYEMGRTLRNLNQYPEAIAAFRQALAYFEETGDRQRQGEAINGIGQVHQSSGRMVRALAAFQRALRIFEETGDRLSQGYALNNIGVIHRDQGHYTQALAAFQQAADRLATAEPRTSLFLLNNVGTLYAYLGQYQRALTTYQQALSQSQVAGYLSGEGDARHNLGFAYRSQGQYDAALAQYQQALAIRRASGDRAKVVETLNNLGTLYTLRGDTEMAIAVLQEALAIYRQLGDGVGEGLTRDTLATAYREQGEFRRALEAYLQALTLMQPAADRRGEIITRSNIGQLFERQGNVGLAIAFYKQAINLIEETRQEIRPLPRKAQERYANTVADTYRQLADLLLQQERVLEAQRVLDLLKVQELDNSLEGLRRNGLDSTVPLLGPETEIWQASQQQLDRAIAVAEELQALRQAAPQTRSDAQNQRIVELEQRQGQLLSQFIDFVNSQPVQRQLEQLSQTAQRQDLLTELDRFPNLQDNLVDIGDAALLYPLILEDRLELVLVTAQGPPIHYGVPVSRRELVQKIFEFQTALRDPSLDPRPLAQALYQWLFAPISDVMDNMAVQTLLYAPDGPLRYIPLAALHDGEDWLAQRYQVNHITAASLMDLHLHPSPAPSVLAGAFSQGNFQVPVLDRTLEFSGLPYAGVEVDLLSQFFPTQSFFDTDFSRRAIAPLLNDHTIIHFATHAALLVDAPLDSFIMFGDGDRLTLAELRNWRGRLRSIDLIVLSACETGSGAIQDETGEEILGFGYLMQDAGARAVVASLWAVSDGGTQALMTHFYQALLADGMTKAEALQQAQVALITGQQLQADADAERGVTLRPRTPAAIPISGDLSHPYYWAPFILIGNGL